MTTRDPKPMMDLDKLRIFHAVVEAKSFTHAADGLDVNQSTVSRQISQLEEDINAQLFHRTPRGLSLTEQGEMLHRATQQIFGIIADTETALLDSKEKANGVFRVTATVGLGTYWLMPRVRKFIAEHPDIELKVLLEDRELDLDHREADVAIRMRQPVQPDLIQRKLFDVSYHIYAAPDYIKRHGIPRSCEELDCHNVITYGDAPTELKGVNWITEVGRKPGEPRRAILSINSLPAMLRAAECGLGLACLPDYSVCEVSTLQRIDCPLEAPGFEAYLCYSEHMKGSKRVNVFRDFLLHQAKEWCY